jgi:hypothetical protein
MLLMNTKPPMPVSESTTMNVIVSNLTPPDRNLTPTYSVCSYTLPSESAEYSVPLSERAVRLGNSLLNAAVPESAILRDGDEGF